MEGRLAEKLQFCQGPLLFLNHTGEPRYRRETLPASILSEQITVATPFSINPSLLPHSLRTIVCDNVPVSHNLIRLLAPGGALYIETKDPNAFEQVRNDVVPFQVEKVGDLHVSLLCRKGLELEGWYGNQLMGNFIFSRYNYRNFFTDYIHAMQEARIYVTDIEGGPQDHNSYLRYWLSKQTPWVVGEYESVCEKKEPLCVYSKRNLCVIVYMNGRMQLTSEPLPGCYVAGVLFQ